MGDGFKLSKDKRHRSSSSIAGGLLEGTRSERKINLRGKRENSNSVTLDFNAYSGAASIPELDDQFMLAETRCDQLRDKIDLIKALKRKRKIKKRSLTRVNEVAADMPLISVRTQPKKKTALPSGRPKHVRGRAEPTAEQHLGKLLARQGADTKKKSSNADMRTPKTVSGRRSVRGDGGDMPQPPALQSHGDSGRLRADRRTRMPPAPAPRDDYSDGEFYDPGLDHHFYPIRASAPSERRHRYTPREVLQKDSSQSAATQWSNESSQTKKSAHGRLATPPPSSPSPALARRSALRRPHGDSYLSMSQQQHPLPQQQHPLPQQQHPLPQQQHPLPQQQQQWPARHEGDRNVVELFSKRASPEPQRRRKVTPHGISDGDLWNMNQASDNEARFVNVPSDKVPPLQSSFQDIRPPRRLKYRTRRYELPTVASQMKQAGAKFYYGANGGNQIPFVVSKSTAPSHNIGVNIQQVLNGLKIQQPLTGIPLTIAHHMGLRHMPYNTRSEPINARPQEPTLDPREINMIKVGRRLVRLPSYKYISYSRLLAMFREGDGMVPRFLRAINRPHCFYSSMYNLATNRTASTSKCGYSGEAKQALAEYAALYREYELLEQRLKDGGGMEPERVARRDELARELSSREGHIRRVVHDYKSVALPEGIRASQSTAGSGRRVSTYKMNLTEPRA